MAQVLSFASFLQNIQIPANIKPLTISLPSPPKLEGPLSPNTLLAKVRTHADGKVLGPESMVVYKGYTYTGQADGWVVEVDPKGNVRKIARLALKSCGKAGAEEGACGRPMGIRVDSKRNLVVVDAYNGLFGVSPRTGEVTWLVNSRTLLVNGRPLGYLNDLTIASDGKVFFTSSSSRWTLAKDSNILFEADNTGRVLVYDPQAQKAEDRVKELISNLAFPNGIQISKDQDYLLIAEGSRCRIVRAWIGANSPKRNTIDEFAANLPGVVDNIRQSPRGTFWVGVSQARHHQLPMVLDKYGDQPKLRAILVMLVNNKVHFSNPRFGIVLELDSQGRVVQSLQDPMGWRFNSVSEVQEENGILFFASPDKESIGIARLKWFPADRNETSILKHPTVMKFMQEVQTNMLRMTDRGLKQALVSLVQQILVSRQRLASLQKANLQRQSTLERLRQMLQEGGGSSGGGGGGGGSTRSPQTTTCGNCGSEGVTAATSLPVTTTTAAAAAAAAAAAVAAPLELR